MRKVLLVLVGLVGMSGADVNFMGTSGLFRTQRATPLGANRVGVGLFFSMEDPGYYGDTLFNFESRISMGFAPARFAELSFSGGGGIKIHGEDVFSGTAESGWLDTRVALKAGTKLWKIFSGGASFFYEFPTKSDTFLKPLGVLEHKAYYGGQALLSLNLREINPENPLSLHFNIGKRLSRDKTKEAKEPWQSLDLTLIGAGVSIETEILDLILEYTVEKPEGFDFGESPQRITPGLRFRSAKTHSVFDIGVDFALGKKVGVDGRRPLPDWTAFLGFLWVSPAPLPPAPPPDTLGILAGTVRDAETKEPLPGVSVRLPEALVPQVVTDALGAFTITDIPQGIIRVELSKEGYKKTSDVVTIEGGSTTIEDFEMYPVPKPILVPLAGKVISQEDQNPVSAEIVIEGKDTTLETRTQPETGIFKLELPPGTYTVTARAEDFISQSQPVVLKEKEGTVMNFSLLKRGMHIVLRGVTFEFNKATLKPESFPILDEAAQILLKNPKIRVEIQGHTDSIGSERYNRKLSQMRAEAVRQYLIFKGVSPTRLVAKGYGESVPIADNSTEEGRALNRRVEFVILGEE